MRGSDERLGELILYIAQRTLGDRAAGATKLNKYLYFSDMAAMRLLGRPLTGTEYRKLQFGPAPVRLLAVRTQLMSDGAARMEQRTDAFGRVHHELLANRPPKDGLFSEEELRLVDDVIDELRGLTAAEVSGLSHREAGWQLVDDGEVIPYELAFVLAPGEARATPAIRAEGERLRAEYGDRLA